MMEVDDSNSDNGSIDDQENDYISKDKPKNKKSGVKWDDSYARSEDDDRNSKKLVEDENNHNENSKTLKEIKDGLMVRIGIHLMHT